MRNLIKNPWTRDNGYVIARWHHFAGWFVVYRTSDASPAFAPFQMDWFVESKKIRQRIYTPSADRARMIAILAVDGVAFEKWDWEFGHAMDEGNVAVSVRGAKLD